MAGAEEELLPILFMLNGGVQVSKGHGPLLTPLLCSESYSMLNRSSSCYIRTTGEDAKMRMEVHGLHIRMKTHHPWCREMDAVVATGDSSMALNRRSKRCPSVGQICGYGVSDKRKILFLYQLIKGRAESVSIICVDTLLPGTLKI